MGGFMEAQKELQKMLAEQLDKYLGVGGCPLCSSELKVDLEVNQDGMEVREIATCPTCQVTAKSKKHSLQ